MPAGSMFFRTLVQTPPEQWAKMTLSRQALPVGSMFFRTLVQTPPEQWAKKPLARIATLRTQSTGDVIPMMQTALKTSSHRML